MKKDKTATSYEAKALEYLRKSKETDDMDLSDFYYKQYIEYTFKGDLKKGNKDD